MTVFLHNKYSKWYFNIISSAQARTEDLVYFEKHHILPKSLGGKNNKENLVNLTAREHFICYRLLTKMVSTTKHKYQMWNAFSCMLYRENSSQQRYQISSKKFETIKKAGADIKSQLWSGENNPMYNKTHSAESREKMKIAATGRIRSDEYKENLSNSLKNKPKSKKHKANMKASAAKRWTLEAREQWGIKMKERALLKKQKGSQECLV